MSKTTRLIEHSMKVHAISSNAEREHLIRGMNKVAFLQDYATDSDKKMDEATLYQRTKDFEEAQLVSTGRVVSSINNTRVLDDLLDAGVHVHKLSNDEIREYQVLKMYDQTIGGNETSFSDRLKNAAPQINEDLSNGGFKSKGSMLSSVNPGVAHAIAFGNGTPEGNKEPGNAKIMKKILENENVRLSYSALQAKDKEMEQNKTLLGRIKNSVSKALDNLMDGFKREAPLPEPSGEEIKNYAEKTQAEKERIEREAEKEAQIIQYTEIMSSELSHEEMEELLHPNEMSQDATINNTLDEPAIKQAIDDLVNNYDSIGSSRDAYESTGQSISKFLKEFNERKENENRKEEELESSGPSM